MYITKNCVKTAIKEYYGSGQTHNMVALGGYETDKLSVTGVINISPEDEDNNKHGYMFVFEDASGGYADHVMLLEKDVKFADFVEKCAEFYNENIQNFIEDVSDALGYDDDGWDATETELMTWQRI